MTVVGKNQVRDPAHSSGVKHEAKAGLYMDKLLAFPVEVQDQIIEEVSNLPHCTNKAIAKVLSQYAGTRLKA